MGAPDKTLRSNLGEKMTEASASVWLILASALANNSQTHFVNVSFKEVTRKGLYYLLFDLL